MYTLAHLHVICRDMEKMIRFWREALSAEFVEYRTFGDDPGAIMRFGGLEIYFKEIPQAKELQSGQVGYEHVGVYVPHLETSVESLYAGVHARQSEPRRLRPGPRKPDARTHRSLIPFTYEAAPVFPCRAASYPFQSLSCWRAEAFTETNYETHLSRHKKAEPLRLRFFVWHFQTSRKRLSASRAAA